MTARERKVIEARAALELLLRYCDGGVTITKPMIERVLESIKQVEVA